METNQLAPQTPPPREMTEYLPIRVAYVHAIGADMKDPFIPEMRGFCHDLKVQFTTREYSPRKYSEDRDFIERLPALQLDEGRYNHKTFYPNTRPYQIVEEAVRRYQNRQRNKESTKEVWKERLTKLQDSLVSLFHRKTRMEQVEDEQKASKSIATIAPEPVSKKTPQTKKLKVLSSIN